MHEKKTTPVKYFAKNGILLIAQLWTIICIIYTPLSIRVLDNNLFFLGHLLYETFDIEEKPGVCRSALRKLEEMFYKTDHLRTSVDLVAILMVGRLAYIIMWF